MRVSRIGAAALVLTVLGASACSDDSGKSSAASTTAKKSSESSTTVAKPVVKTLKILVTNDDGIAAEGISAVVAALAALPDVEVTVVAPNENKSGSGSSVTPGELTVNDASTLAGFKGKAVVGFPADTIIWAIDKGGITMKPHLVVSGINNGANVGPLVAISGTVGAAKAAVQRGIPALAASQGLGIDSPADFPSGVKYVVDWVMKNRDALVDGSFAKKVTTVTNLNVPTCSTGKIRGEIETTVAVDATDRDLVKSNCESTVNISEFKDDVDAFDNGYASVGHVELSGVAR